MYGPLWRVLPGPAWLKAIVVLLVGLFFLLMEVVLLCGGGDHDAVDGRLRRLAVRFRSPVARAVVLDDGPAGTRLKVVPWAS